MQAQASLSAREWRIIAMLGFQAFAWVVGSVAIAALLAPIASEFEITPGTAGLLVSAFGAPGI